MLQKPTGILKAADHWINLNCDQSAQYMLQPADSEGLILLYGEDYDHRREKLVEKIIDIIARESSTELIKTEVDVVTEVHFCERWKGETASEFVNRFNGALARYTNQAGSQSELPDLQFATLLIRNAKMSPDTTKSIVFQLTAYIKSSGTKGSKLTQMEINKVQIILEQVMRCKE